MIYDCIPFWRDLHMLELRFREYDSLADRFVVAEASITHTGQAYRRVLRDHWSRFAPWHDRIVYVDADPWLLDRGSVWRRECASRDALSQGLAEARPDDCVILSDQDEFAPVELLREYAQRGEAVWFRACWHFYWLNGHVGARGVGPRLFPYRLLDRYSPSEIRCIWDFSGRLFRVEEQGVHFSFTGGPDAAAEKVTHFGLHERFGRWPYTEPGYHAWAMSQRRTYADGSPIRVQWPLDEHYPQALRSEPERWRPWLLLEGADGDMG